MKIKTDVVPGGKICAKGNKRQATVKAENTSYGHAMAAYTLLERMELHTLPPSAVKGAKVITEAGMSHAVVFEIEN